jgi:hypothetical protein
MKKAILILSISCGLKMSAQNTFPATGNVGIGNASSPSAALYVQGVANTFACDGNPLLKILGVQPNTCLKDLALIQTTQTILGPIRTEFIIKNSGNVGIGTATPTEKLDVAGNIRINDNNIYFRTDNNHGLGWYGTGKLFAGITYDGPVLYGWGSGALGTTAGGQKAILNWNSNGQVAIGNVNTPAGYSLYVEKGVLAEKFKCALKTTGDWSDYVFAKDYKLKSLEEVDSYIQTNKHLPDVPSAEEVVCDGIDMAKMDAKLLQKIEELTLYLIELKKENQVIKAELINLKK